MRCAWCGHSHRQMYGEGGASPQACINYLQGEVDRLSRVLKLIRDDPTATAMSRAQADIGWVGPMRER